MLVFQSQIGKQQLTCISSKLAIREPQPLGFVTDLSCIKQKQQHPSRFFFSPIMEHFGSESGEAFPLAEINWLLVISAELLSLENLFPLYYLIQFICAW